MILTKKKKKFIKKKKIKQFRKKNKKKLINFFLIVLSIIFFFFFIKNLIFSEKQIIKKITFTENSVRTFNNPLLYQKIIKLLSGKNIFLIKLFLQKEIQQKIKKEYPIIKKIEINRKKQTAIINIQFNKPLLIFFNQKEYIGYLSGKRFLINKNSPWIKQISIINLPYYVSKYSTNLTGLFYKISPLKLKNDFNKIQQNLKVKKIIYFPGGLISKVQLLSGPILFFNHQKNINKQLSKLLYIKKLFSGFNDLYYIDLGSQDNLSFGIIK